MPALLARCTTQVFFASWGISVYPQLYHNWLRKSAAGLSMDFLCLNLAGFICFAAYNCSLVRSPCTALNSQVLAPHLLAPSMPNRPGTPCLTRAHPPATCLRHPNQMWSPDVRAEYAARYGGSPAVHINDAMLPLHASGITAITIAQCLAYGRRQRARCAAAGLPSPTRLSGVAVAVLAALAGTIAAYAAAVWALQGRAAPGGWCAAAAAAGTWAGLALRGRCPWGGAWGDGELKP